MLLTLTQERAFEVSENPPDRIVEVQPVHLIYAGGASVPSSISYDRSTIGRSPTDRIVVVPPSEATQYIGILARHRVEVPERFKLYRRVDGRLEYHEAWHVDGGVIEHWGTCGDRGETRRHSALDTKEQGRVLGWLRSVAHASGFRPIAPSRMVTLVVECPIASFGLESDLGRRHALEDFLSEQTGWMGLGHCDGGSGGSGSMEAFAIVVDGKIAMRALTAALAASPFSDFKVRAQPRHRLVRCR